MEDKNQDLVKKARALVEESSEELKNQDNLLFIIANSEHEHFIRFEGKNTDLCSAFKDLSDQHEEFIDIMLTAMLNSIHADTHPLVAAIKESITEIFKKHKIKKQENE